MVCECGTAKIAVRRAHLWSEIPTSERLKELNRWPESEYKEKPRSRKRDLGNPATLKLRLWLT